MTTAPPVLPPKADAQQINYAIGHVDGKVVVQFAQPVKWLSYSPDAALEYATAMRNRVIDAKAWLKAEAKKAKAE